jgi:chemotaxis methyl-accepting protein methylase
VRELLRLREVNPLDLVETIREGILVLKPDLTVRFANRSFCLTFAVAPEHIVGRKLYEKDVSAARLARFFTKEDHSYRVTPELRSVVVFTVQDLLADPPFSRLDLVSCRNLLIYLRPEAQEKVVALLYFALREGGVVLLGGAETIRNVDGRFEAISKADRIYRRIGLADRASSAL